MILGANPPTSSETHWVWTPVYPVEGGVSAITISRWTPHFVSGKLPMKTKPKAVTDSEATLFALVFPEEVKLKR